jgi:hypothetical protein
MPVLEVLNLPWVDIGTKRPAAWAQSLLELFENKTYF